jgi:hypothetical protein
MLIVRADLPGLKKERMNPNGVTTAARFVSVFAS